MADHWPGSLSDNYGGPASSTGSIAFALLANVVSQYSLTLVPSHFWYQYFDSSAV